MFQWLLLFPLIVWMKSISFSKQWSSSLNVCDWFHCQINIEVFRLSGRHAAIKVVFKFVEFLFGNISLYNFSQAWQPGSPQFRYGIDEHCYARGFYEMQCTLSIKKNEEFGYGVLTDYIVWSRGDIMGVWEWRDIGSGRPAQSDCVYR